MLEYTLYDGSKLYVSAPYFLKEVIEIERIVGIESFTTAMCIPFYLMFVLTG